MTSIDPVFATFASILMWDLGSVCVLRIVHMIMWSEWPSICVGTNGIFRFAVFSFTYPVRHKNCTLLIGTITVQNYTILWYFLAHICMREYPRLHHSKPMASCNSPGLNLVNYRICGAVVKSGNLEVGELYLHTWAPCQCMWAPCWQLCPPGDHWTAEHLFIY